MRCIVFGDHYRAANVPSAIWPFGIFPEYSLSGF